MEGYKKVTIYHGGDADSLLNEFLPLYSAFKDVSFNQKTEIDISKLKWINPLMVLFLSSFINYTNSEYRAEGEVSSYLKTIKFPNGISLLKDGLKNKNYTPIYNFGKEFLPVDDFLTVVKNNIESFEYIEYPFSLTVSELFDNIIEHSKSEKNFIISQYYPLKKYLESCIIDNGIGLRQTYLEKNIECLSDEKAIELALSGESTKPGNERGCGLNMIIKIICEGLKGEVLLVSGSSLAFFKESKTPNLLNLDNFSWKGLIVAFRIPKTNKKINTEKYY